eukprot:11622596-Alexandrium_andersonii.AAC.1
MVAYPEVPHEVCRWATSLSEERGPVLRRHCSSIPADRLAGRPLPGLDVRGRAPPRSGEGR